MDNGKNGKYNPSRRLSIAYIIGTYPEITTTFIDREMDTLRAMGFRIQVVSIRRPEDSAALKEDYAVIQDQVFYLLPVHWAVLILAHIYFMVLRPKAFLGTLWSLLSGDHPRSMLRIKTLLHFGEGVYAAYYLHTKKWDHIHAHFIDRAATVAMVASRLLDIPYSVTAHADDIYNDPVLAEAKLSGAKFAVTVSGFNRAYLLKRYPRLNPSKLHVLHPWIDLRSFKMQAVRHHDEGRFRILSVGRLVENKGHRYLIEACSMLQKEGIDFECQIIGEGPLRAELEALIYRWNLQDRVCLRGSQPQSEVWRSLSLADVFVLACVVAKNGDRDGMPVAIAEAMSMEVPVISTNILGIPEMVQPEAGLLVPPEDAAGLAAALREIYQTGPVSRSEIGRRGRQVIQEHFDLFTGILELASLFLNSGMVSDLREGN